MSDIKKTALIILIITLLSNTFTQYAYAANDYNHSELLEYEGYGQAMYESIVEQTTYVTGQYTDNKEYVNDSIDQIKDYADFWSNERQMLEGACGGTALFTSSCLGTLAETAGGYALTIGDWVKNLFNDYTVENEPEPLTGLEPFFTYDKQYQLIVNEGFYTSYNGGRNISTFLYAHYRGPNDWTASGKGWAVYLANSNNGMLGSEIWFDDRQTAQRYVDTQNASLTSVTSIISAYQNAGLTVSIYKQQNSQYIPVDINRPDRNTSVTDINNYIQENPISVPLPQLKPQLVCPDGTKISMNINGSTFLSVDGTVMMVEKDGTAQVNGELCNLNWQKPTVEYNPNGEPVVTNPDGTSTNLNTGDTTTKPPGATDLEGCTGVLCGIGKLLDGVGSIVKAIGDLVKKLLDGILALFVPEDLDFMTEEFNKITKKLNDKIAITETLKDAIKSVFQGGGGNPLANISINLPITNEPLTFGNVSFIEEGVPILRKVISAIVVLYTIAYVYRKITGRGGVMER